MKSDRDPYLVGNINAKISSSKLGRSFGELRQIGDDKAIVVTYRGNATHVLTTMDHYTALQQAVSSDGTTPVSRVSLNELVNCFKFGVILIDYDLRIAAINRVAQIQLEQYGDKVLGFKFFDVFSNLQGSQIETHIKRSSVTKEAYTAKVKFSLNEDIWLHVKIHPGDQYLTVSLYCITDEIKSRCLTNGYNSMRNAIASHEGLGYAYLNNRGYIDYVEETFCGIVCLPKNRLCGVALAELIPVERRVVFREALDRVMSGEEARSIDSEILSNSGTAVAVRIAIAELRGTYGNEGAIILLTIR